MNKKVIVVLFGGRSSEHEVSCVSATTIISNIDTEKYDIIKVGITKEGKWLLFEGDNEAMLNGQWINQTKEALISPDTTKKELLVKENGSYTSIKIDVVYLALHGKYGEDGTVQGLLELAGIPYIGPGVLASSVAMDKVFTKIIVDTLNIRQAKFEYIKSENLDKIDAFINKVEASLDYPVFVKPSNSGSSQGCSKAHTREELVAAIYLAAKHDRKVLVEETIVGKEVECAVLGNYSCESTKIGEIVMQTQFYDYESKYGDKGTVTVIDPEDIDEETKATVSRNAKEIFEAIDGFGLSRVDFFVEDKTNEIVFNEINTLPGCTSISMYAKLWEASGIDNKTLFNKIIELAFERNA